MKNSQDKKTFHTTGFQTKIYRTAGLFRRLFAIVYDGFLLIAILFLTTAIANALKGGDAISPDDTYYYLYVIVIFVLCFLYFTWFWLHGGQTLGMKTWRMRVVSDEGNALNTEQALKRSIFAIVSLSFFGLGYLWAFVDKKNRCWHDIASKTILLDLRQQQ